MIGAVQDRPGQVVEAGVDQIERVVAHLLDRADFGHQVAALGDQVAARLDLQPQLVAEGIFQPPAGGVPQAEVGVQIDVRSAGPIGNRQAAAGADRGQRAADFAGRFSSAPQTWARCSRSVPEPMCMCRPVTPRP